jgi:hypothetical protein
MDNRRNSILEVYKRVFEIFFKNGTGIIVIAILTSILVADLKETPKLELFSNPKILLLIIVIALTLFNYFIKYLESDKSIDRNSERLREELNELRHILRNTSRNSYQDKELIEELKNLKEQINDSQTKGLDLNEVDKNKLFELFESKLEKNLSQEFLETIQQKFGADILASERYSDLQRDLIEFKERLRLEIRGLSLRANTNLAIGSVTTLVAVIVLYITIVSNHINFNDSVSMISYFIPRISLVIFIEVFAFFFLKLYKSNLDNVRYYHNEMTNIETRIIALKSSIINADKSTINEVIKELSKTERNFVIKKGETTIELERLRSEKNENKSLIEFARSIITKHTDK